MTIWIGRSKSGSDVTDEEIAKIEDMLKKEKDGNVK
jgi:hypothetical protein